MYPVDYRDHSVLGCLVASKGKCRGVCGNANVSKLVQIIMLGIYFLVVA